MLNNTQMVLESFVAPNCCSTDILIDPKREDGEGGENVHNEQGGNFGWSCGEEAIKYKAPEGHKAGGRKCEGKRMSE